MTNQTPNITSAHAGLDAFVIEDHAGAGVLYDVECFLLRHVVKPRQFGNTAELFRFTGTKVVEPSANRPIAWPVC